MVSKAKRKCKWCEKLFGLEGRRDDTIYCNAKCRTAYWRWKKRVALKPKTPRQQRLIMSQLDIRHLGNEAGINKSKKVPDDDNEALRWLDKIDSILQQAKADIDEISRNPKRPTIKWGSDKDDMDKRENRLRKKD